MSTPRQNNTAPRQDSDGTGKSWHRDAATTTAATRTADHEPTRLSILGVTGSIGTSTLDVVAAAPEGRFEIEALTANSDVEGLARAAIKHNARYAAVADPSCYHALSEALSGTPIAVGAGPEALDEAADRDVDCVMAAIVGAAGLRPAMRAATRCRRLALANKECLVIAGTVFMRRIEAAETEILPVDSEHAAIFQVLNGVRDAPVSRILLTASGGPFRDATSDQLRTVTRAAALRHPNWSMGPKVTIDSATLMNKGLELIEAYHLFDLPADRFDALVHPQSIVHGLVEYCDGSVVAQLAAPDMRTPIAQSLFWPERTDCMQQVFDFKMLSSLTFEEVDTERFPAFALARAAMEIGGGAPAVLNAANEIAVAAFLEERLKFLDIATTVGQTLDIADGEGLFTAIESIDDALAVDEQARILARDVMGGMSM